MQHHIFRLLYQARDLVRCAILAEILIVATGVPFLINQAMVKRG